MTDRSPKPPNIKRLTERLKVRAGLTRYSAVEFLIALVLLLVVTPFVEGLNQAELLEGVLLTVVLCSAVLAVGAETRTLKIAVALSIPAVVAKWANHFAPALIPAEVFLLPGMAFVVFVIFQLLRFILSASQVDTEVLCAGIATYLTFGLLWTFAYVLTARVTPNAFSDAGIAGSKVLSGFDALYFSYVTLCTVGFGDITPASPVARMLAVLEALTGTIYLAVLVARLVSMYSVTGPPPQTDNS